jgi:uncharacterized protein YndB with AHSA1/START domain
MSYTIYGENALRLRDTAEPNLTIGCSIELESGVCTVWEALGKIAHWPQWFGWSTVSTPLDVGPHAQVESDFTNLLRPLYPFRGSHRTAVLAQVLPLSVATWEAKGYEVAATHSWTITPLLPHTDEKTGDITPRCKLSVEIKFDKMSIWYFNVMEVGAKMRAACQEVLEKIAAEV